MPPNRMPAAEVDVSADLVRRLLAQQHPELAHLPLLAPRLPTTRHSTPSASAR